MRFESGPAKTDAIWRLIQTVIFAAFALWFVKDGAVGYPRLNAAAAQKALLARPFDGKLTPESLTEAPTMEQFVELGKSRPASRELVRQTLGPPHLTDGPVDYYATRYGYGSVTIQGGDVHMAWKKWPNDGKDKDEIRRQFYWALVPVPLFLYFLYRLVRALTLRISIDADGMVYAGQRIPFSAMVTLRDYSPKGWIDLYYKTDRGEKKLRLDNQKVARFDELVTALCQEKGFPNEVAAFAERQARAAATDEPPTPK